MPIDTVGKISSFEFSIFDDQKVVDLITSWLEYNLGDISYIRKDEIHAKNWSMYRYTDIKHWTHRYMFRTKWKNEEALTLFIMTFSHLYDVEHD